MSVLRRGIRDRESDTSRSSDVPAPTTASHLATRGRGRSAFASLTVFYLTTLIVWAGTWFGVHLTKTCEVHPDTKWISTMTFWERMGPWDGVWYRRIATEGYTYSPSEMSSVAFYPMYPGIGAAVAKTTGLSPAAALLLISHAFLAGAFVLFAFYLRDRPDGLGEDGVDWALLALGLFPTTLYFRMAYSESCFLFLLVLIMCGMRWRWPLFIIALAIGAATATRAVGVAAILPFYCHLWHVSRTRTAFVSGVLLYSPLCIWGIAGYMAYQHHAFGDAFAFTQTQIHWHERDAPDGIWQDLWSWGTLEAYRDVYDSDCVCYWRNVPPGENPLFNLKFLNPLFALFAWGAVGWGYWKKWITLPESLLSLGLLAVPYLTHAHWACASSEARYASVVFPVYIVLGHVLKRMPTALSGALAGASGAALLVFTSLFIAWYWFY